MMRIVRTRLALLAALLAAAGCGGSHHADQARDATPLVPWTEEPVPQLAVSDAAPARPCRASQLRPQKGGFTFHAAVVGATGSVALRNVGGSACRLTGRPAVRFVGAPRAPRQRQVPMPARPPQFPRVQRPSSWLLSLAPGRAATLAVEWHNWCVPHARTGQRLIPPEAVRVTLPRGRGSLEIPYNAVTSCERPGEASTIRVQPFQPPLLPASRPWTDQVLSAKVLTLDGTAAPLHARRGESLRYSVAIRNEGRATVRFDGECPFAVELLAPAGRPEAHRLNCGAARPLAPRATLRFEMRMRIPTHAPVGPNGLFWELDPLGAGGPQVVSRLVVDE
jgi:hypothetical protein